MNTRDANKLCPCGSGLKRKKCSPEQLLEGNTHFVPPPPPPPPTFEELLERRRRSSQAMLKLTTITSLCSFPR